MNQATRAAVIDPVALEEAAEWLMCLSASDVSDEDRAAWAIWRNSSPERHQAWCRAELVMGKLGAVPPSLAMRTLDRPTSPSRRAAVAKLAAILALAPLGWSSWRLTEQQGWTADYLSSVGECRELTLADGTQIFLNTDSAIDVRFDASQRLIRLMRGEILVQTAPDNVVPSRSLRVMTDEGRMQALGTRFSVRETSGRTYLAVLEGAVRIDPTNSKNTEPLVVQAGQKTDFNASTTSTVTPVDKTATAWTQGMLLADKMRLADFIAELGRYRRGFIRYEPAIANLLISGTYPVDDPQRALNMLVLTYPLTATSRLNGYWVSLSPR
ncbi:FecR domain-containing protein [Pseudomonas putida]|uniref:FecR domain-containing protein n=1 Tax=Pseudomonas putida TaxID=303 RepID=UPI003D982375